MRRLWVVLVIVAVSDGKAAMRMAQTKPAATADASLLRPPGTQRLPAAGTRSAGPGVYATGFESPAFTTGPVDGQAGWVSFVGGPEGHVDSANPAGGNQHLRISLDPGVPSGTLTGGFSPDLGPLASGPSTVSVDIAISATGGADYDVAGQSPSEEFLTWRVKFFYLGDIYIVDDIGGGLEFVDTGVNWTVGPYQTLTVCDDPASGSTSYFYGGSLIYSQVTHLGGTRVEQVVLLSDNWHLGENGDFDNLSISSGLHPACGGSGSCESTGFEPVEAGCAWEAGFGVCGSDFVCQTPPYSTMCTDPVGPPEPDNCCENKPHPTNEWFMSVSSQHCQEPHIETANPASGTQHMRFQRSTAGGNPAGCVGFSAACSLTAFSPNVNPNAGSIPLGPAITTTSFDIARELPTPLPGQSIQWSNQSTTANRTVQLITFDFYGYAFALDFDLDQYVYIGAMTGAGVYDHIDAVHDVCNDRIAYYLNGVLRYETTWSSDPIQGIEQTAWLADNSFGKLDVDNYLVTREPCAPNDLEPEPGGVAKNRFVGVVVPPSANRGPGTQTALRVTLTTLNHLRSCCSGQDGNGFGTGCNANALCNLDSNCSGGTPLCRHQLAQGPPTFPGMEGNIRYVNSFPGGSLVCQDDGPPFNTSYRCATLGCDPEYRDWATDLGVAVNPAAPPGLLYVTGDALVPSSTINVVHIAASCGAAPEANTCTAASSPLAIGSSAWGDITTAGFGPPDGKSDVLDIPAVKNKLLGVPTFFAEYRTWLKQRDPAANIDAVTVVDLSDVVDGVLAKPYPASRTIDACPHD